MGEHDSGTRRVAWAELTKLSAADVQSFQDVLITEAARLRLEVKVYVVYVIENREFDGLEIRWRPARGRG